MFDASLYIYIYMQKKIYKKRDIMCDADKRYVDPGEAYKAQGKRKSLRSFYSLEMMKVVSLGRGEERQVVSAVCVERRERRQGEPQPGGRHMRAQQYDAHERWYQVRAYVLERVAIDRGDRDWRRPLVMLLVDVLVEVAVVEQPVGVVEADLLAEDVEGHLGEEAVEGGQVVKRLEAAPLHQPVGGVPQGYSDDYLVEEHHADHPEEVARRHRLVCARLDLVAAQCGWTVRHVHEGVDAADYPVDQE